MDNVITCGFADDVIEKLAGALREREKSGADFSRHCVVFGGKRPALFLRRELARSLKKPFEPPVFFTIDEFASRLCSRDKTLGTPDDLDCCFLLYRLCQEHLPGLLKGRETFSRFLGWGREILKFIEQLDLQDIREEPLKSVEMSAAIGYEVPESVNALLGSINLLRKEFHAALAGQGALTRGMAYLEASRRARDEELPEFDTVFFCNFFYLHTTELRIVQEFLRRGKAVLLFQRDCRSWPVLDTLEKELGIRIRAPEDAAKSGPEKLTVYSAFDTHSQTACLREVLETIPDKEETVIVLPDPDGLVPLLSEISGTAGELNVSMGYPLKRSSLHSLFRLIFAAQASRKSGRYYSRDYLACLLHPVVKNLLLDPFKEPSVARVLVHKTEELLTGALESGLAGRLFVAPEEIEHEPGLFSAAAQTLSRMDIRVSGEQLKETLAVLHELLFGVWEKIDDFRGFTAAMKKLLDTVISASPVETYPLNLLICEQIYGMLARIGNAGFTLEKFGSDEIFRIFSNDLEARYVSFSGTPLKGLQVLGLFETRSLGFDNVLVLDLNESILPRLNIYEPLIPREIMLSLGINRLEKEDEIQRYQFLRLIGGAKQAHLFYSEGVDREKSRFIEELVWERQKIAGSLDVIRPPRVAFTMSTQPGKEPAAKTARMIDFLRTKTYSASSINTYLHCPLRFYYHYVLGLKEKTDLLEETEAADVGTFVHELLQEAYTGFKGMKPVINREFTRRFMSLFESRFEAEFEKKMRSDAFMLKEILRLRLENFLDKEAGRDVAQIVRLEDEERDSLETKTGTFGFVYRIDRVDRLNDASLLVIDYKTGGTDLKPMSYSKIAERGFSRLAMKKSVKSFQLPLYLYFIDRQFPGSRANAAFYNLRSATLSSFLKQEELDKKHEILDVFLQGLDALFAEMLDPADSFPADEENSFYCSTCPFSPLCR